MNTTAQDKCPISVVMSCYNSSRFLRMSIDSILSQTFVDFEFIIWNDGSTDSTEEIIKSYDDKRIKYYSSSNKGLGQALHEACKKASGKYIARMDDDDIALPNRLEKEYNYMESHPDCALVSCAVNYIDEENTPFGYSSPVLTNRTIKKTYSIVHPGVMFRKEFYDKTPGYLNLRTAQDNVLWHFVAKYGKFKNLSEPLLKYRVQRNSIVRKQRVPELTLCCKNIRECIINHTIESGVLPEELITLHNEIFKLNTRLSEQLPPVLDQRNSILKHLTKIGKVLVGEKMFAKLLCFLLTVYYTVK